MITLEDWQARNDAYLGAALADLRRRLERATQAAQAPAQRPAAPAPAPSEPPRAPARGPLAFLRRSPHPTVTGPGEQPLLGGEPTPLPPEAAFDGADGDPPPALVMLAQRFGLSDFERQVLLLCVANELDTGIAGLCAAAQRQPERDHPSFALAMALLDGPAWEALSPERPLRYWRLVEISQPAGRALTASALRADERIVNFVKGLNHLDDRLAPLLVGMPRPPVEQLPTSQQAAALALREALDAPPQGAGLPWPAARVAVLRGAHRDSKRQVAGACAAALDLHLYRLSADALNAAPQELDTLARLWHRESLLLPLMLYVDAHDLDRSGGPEGAPARLARLLVRTGGRIIVDTRDGLVLPEPAALTLDIAKPSAGEQREAWREVIESLGGVPAEAGPADEDDEEDDPVATMADDLAGQLAAQFDLSQPEIEAIGHATARGTPPADARALKAALWRAGMQGTRPHLERLAQRLDAKATWGQIVLPEAEMAQLRQIAAQVRSRSRVYDEWGFRARMNRGLGVSALFAGDSGTGKTMASEVLSRALRLDLYRIDLSAVVSKYIGETEKNLREVFDAAEAGGAILLFDEADALFGKRSEVKDSHDRYANIEIDYLLQRMESYGGLAILATNMKSALDPAFVRRLRFIVNFPYPSQAQRRGIWQRAFPAETPLDALDVDRLARLSLSGGNIHSIALHAAFLAARAGTDVTMPLVLEAARMELRKLDRPVNEADFRAAEGPAVQRVRA
ncbi:ATP-binding protein [Paucibacter sp. PLA-PC-4]|uniref:ATP-binding protein n=1 Tax=Paucibacter sp. PLA-PC-4 TaxID=2993655 RepID=UPI00224AE3AD|nr:ATP-binding protein [Paucibacter sp. PLA-PC-4]MCX2864882.1 ATP-binding protein [Paucibacter sp. PLA-PC-4]